MSRIATTAEPSVKMCSAAVFCFGWVTFCPVFDAAGGSVGFSGVLKVSWCSASEAVDDSLADEDGVKVLPEVHDGLGLRSNPPAL